MGSINSIPGSIIYDLNQKIGKIIQKYDNPIATLDADIAKTEDALALLLGNLTGDAFDMAAIKEMKKILEGVDE